MNELPIIKCEAVPCGVVMPTSLASKTCPWCKRPLSEHEQVTLALTGEDVSSAVDPSEPSGV